MSSGAPGYCCNILTSHCCWNEPILHHASTRSVSIWQKIYLCLCTVLMVSIKYILLSTHAHKTLLQTGALLLYSCKTCMKRWWACCNMSLISPSSAEQKLKSHLHDESRESNVHQPDIIWKGCFHSPLSALTLIKKRQNLWSRILLFAPNLSCKTLKCV